MCVLDGDSVLAFFIFDGDGIVRALRVEIDFSNDLHCFTRLDVDGARKNEAEVGPAISEFDVVEMPKEDILMYNPSAFNVPSLVMRH